MKNRFLVTIALAITAALASCSSTHPSKHTPAQSASQAPRLLNADLETLVGPVWHGKLTYLNYGSEKLSTIPTSLLVARTSEGVWSWATGYDDEPHADSASEVRLIEDGHAIQSGDTIERVLSKARDGGTVMFTTEHSGTDDNRSAMIRREYRIAPGEFSIRKLVKFDGEGDFFQRHEYRWKR